MSILCIICAREGSKGVVGKALRLLNDKPLVAYTIEQALSANIFDHVVISTDSNYITDKRSDYYK